MYDKIYSITLVVLTIIYAIFQFVRRKLYRAKEQGIEETTRAIEEFKQKKIKEQFQVVKERSDMLFIEFLEIFCTKMGVSQEGKEAKIYNDCVLNYIRKETDEIMKRVIYVDNIATKEGANWINYKEKKLEYIFSTIANNVNQIWNEDLIGYKRQEIVSKCRDEMHSVYINAAGNIFEEIRGISITYKKEIDRYKKLLEDIKYGKGKKK